jgi:hypothetical protein
MLMGHTGSNGVLGAGAKLHVLRIQSRNPTLKTIQNADFKELK